MTKVEEPILHCRDTWNKTSVVVLPHWVHMTKSWKPLNFVSYMGGGFPWGIPFRFNTCFCWYSSSTQFALICSKFKVYWYTYVCYEYCSLTTCPVLALSQAKIFLLTAMWHATLTFAKNRFVTHSRGDLRALARIRQIHFQIITPFSLFVLQLRYDRIWSGIICFVLHLLRIPSGQVWAGRSVALCLERDAMLPRSLTVCLSDYTSATAHVHNYSCIKYQADIRPNFSCYVVLRPLYMLRFDHVWFSRILWNSK